MPTWPCCSGPWQPTRRLATWSPGTRGVRKLAWTRPGMGKRGGLRVLYYVQDVRGRIWLLTVYTKSARENIAVATLNALRELADHAEID